MKFIKNIKFIVENNKLSSVIFCLEKTNIKKLKEKLIKYISISGL